MRSRSEPTRLRRSLAGVPLWTWAGAALVSMVMIGPGLRPGALLNLDLVVIDGIPVPHGMWGLGPELPRRVPLWGPIAWVSTVLGGEFVVKTMMVAAIVVAAAGMYRLVSGSIESSTSTTALGAAALYAIGPFLLTRLAVGQLNVVWVMALLPWAIPHLLEPSRSSRKVLWWSAAFGIAGVFGGIVFGSFLAAGLVAERSRRLPTMIIAFVVGQLPWLASLAVVTLTSQGQGASIAGSTSFRPPLADIGDGARLFAGMGFWNGPFQVGREQPALGAIVGVMVFLLALLGTRELPPAWRGPLTALGLGSLVFSASSSLWGVERVVNGFTDTPLGTPFRETQRFLVPYVLWAFPAAAAGAARLGRSLRPEFGATLNIVPFAAAVALAGPALWGLGGQLDPTTFPKEWQEARGVIAAQPGTVLALPWYQYFTLDIAHDHLVLDVVPYYFGGDVLTSSDPNLSRDRQQEVPDPREQVMNAIVADARRGAPVSERLVALGVRWIVFQHEVDWELYTGIPTDTGLERVVSGDTMDLYHVRGWRGPVLADDGHVVGFKAVAAPLQRVDGSGPATYMAPYQSGWLRGWSTTERTPFGLIGLPGGSGLVWFWPALVVTGADLIVLAMLLTSLVPGRLRTYWTRGRSFDTGKAGRESPSSVG